MTQHFDDQVLDEFAHQFYGYGNYDGRYWFIGMEEGGGNSFAEVGDIGVAGDGLIRLPAFQCAPVPIHGTRSERWR